MSAHAGHRHQLQAAASSGPTKTKTVRKIYAQRLRGAYQAINAAVRTGVIDNDVFSVGSGSSGTLTADVDPPDFQFEQRADKIDAFETWLEEAQQNEIIEPWGNENRFIKHGYERGFKNAETEARKAGVDVPDDDVQTLLRTGVHRDQLQALYTRNFKQLQGMTADVASSVSRELSEGLASGEGPRKVARRITDVIGTIDDGTPRGAMARATTIARTELLNSAHTGTLTRFGELGVELVKPLLAPDACDQCIAIAQDAPYKRSEAFSIWPVHPNCRCGITVYTGS